MKGHTDEIHAICFSPNGQLIASGSLDHTIKLWNTQTGKLLHTLQGHTHRIKSISFSPDGKLIVSVSADHTIRLWDVQTGALLVTLYTFESEAWVAVTPDGHYDASPDGLKYLYYSDGVPTYPLEHATNLNYQKGLLASIMN